MGKLGVTKGAMPPAARMAFLCVLLLLAGAALAMVLLNTRGPTARVEIPTTPEVPTQQLRAAAEDDELLELTADTAMAENERIPFSSDPIEAAVPLHLESFVSNPLFRKRAVDCLTSAVYYEAGFQSDQERRAVAQVVLNRVRHPAYPASVCEVVYEGSARRTGCQFTFTCDGSEARSPQRWAWDEARQIAQAALSGAVEPSVGMATHYHAEYVVPKWAFNLTKIKRVGMHYFYRFPGSWGRRAAYRQQPMADELAELAETDALIEEIAPSGAETAIVPSPLFEDDRATGPLVDAGPAGPELQPSILRADERAGTLIEPNAGTLGN